MSATISFPEWQQELRAQIRGDLGIPADMGTSVNLDPEPRGEMEHDGLVIEKWVWTAEPGSRVPGLLYRPADPPESSAGLPAVVFTYGHGGSKSGH